jgi:hypothetical protein
LPLRSPEKTPWLQCMPSVFHNPPVRCAQMEAKTFESLLQSANGRGLISIVRAAGVISSF